MKGRVALTALGHRLKPYLAGAQWAWSLTTERPAVPIWWAGGIALPLLAPGLFATGLPLLLYDAGFLYLAVAARRQARARGFEDLLTGNGLAPVAVGRVWFLAVMGLLGATAVFAAALAALLPRVDPEAWIWHIFLRSLWSAGLVALAYQGGLLRRLAPYLAVLPAALLHLMVAMGVAVWPPLAHLTLAWSPVLPVAAAPALLGLPVPLAAIAYLWTRRDP